MKRIIPEPHPYLREQDLPRLLAHRGYVSKEDAQSGVLENTRAAFISAYQAGATAIESDCHLTSDGEVVLTHDADLMRLTGESCRVNDLTLAELRSRFTDRGGLLTLGEAYEMLPDALWNIDVKDALAAHHAGAIIAPHWRRTLLTSFNDRIRLKALDHATTIEDGKVCKPATSPGQRRMLKILRTLYTRPTAKHATVFAGLDALQIPERQGPIPVFTPRLVRSAKRSGVEVHVWTVNNPADMQRLVAHGAAGIVTDRLSVARGEFSA